MTQPLPITTAVALPVWPNSHRALPNALARSALFNTASARKGERERYWQHEVPVPQGTRMLYTGEELRQDDEDVYLQVLHLARLEGLGDEVFFTAHAMLVEVGWTVNSKSYERLSACLYRLTAATVSLTVQDKRGLRETYAGSLLRSFRWRESPDGPPLSQWRVRVEPELAALFDPAYYSRVVWAMRLELPPLGKWLHMHYSTHAYPFPVRVATLHKLCGSDTVQLKQWRYKLKIALAALVESGFFLSAHIDPKTDLVHVERKYQVEA